MLDLSGVAGRGAVRHRPLGADFGGTITYLAVIKIVFLSRNLDQNMPKNTLCLRKKCKICCSI